ncbi:MAG: HAMP domain-containing histidine kinase [Clostridiaceae bacterium]|nr:HAMP domain-containing histidine kinase [Clostridiaceae bacterium]MBW4860708.1 HAMP domain-containing histidine kinase [Clostridiaceae bacterium]MBW4869038.1 HAMP domain-containing histidine kinase [Clostridiaceae bacterium]
MKSIKTRLVGNFMLVIIITVVILELVLLNAAKQYYYKSLEDVLSNQIRLSSEFYSRYFSTSSLEDLIVDDVDVFWEQTNAQVQILDLRGNVLMDSIGVDYPKIIQTPDVLKAKNGEKGTWIGNVEYDSSPVMAVSYPLISDGNIIGIMRFIASLSSTNKIIRNISLILLWIGFIVVLISGLVSIFLANTIVKPLKEVTGVAEKMADGQLKVRSQKKYDDEIGKLSDTLNYMAEELIKKDQLKNDFISSISHELRTPLTSIKGWAITLKAEDLSDNPLLEDGLDIIEKESDRLTYMVEELLDFSRFVSDRITLNKEEMDITKVLKQITKQLTPRANLKNIKLNLDIKEELPIILGDGNRIKQVFINLIDNSLKFTPKAGNISLSARMKGQYVVVSVEDCGCGIPKEDLPYVKEKFYKGKNSKSNSGLGLSISDEIVKLHGGFIKIESEVNLGTKISVFLPTKEELIK